MSSYSGTDDTNELREAQAPSRWHSPAVLALAALVTIQIIVGMLFKAVQKDDKYVFSPPSVICVSEMLKFFTAAGLFCLSRPSQSKNNYVLIQPLYAINVDRSTSSTPDKEQHSDRLVATRNTDWTIRYWLPSRRWLASILSAIKECFKSGLIYGFTNLALLYSVMNNLAFVLHTIADPGTVNLLRSSNTLVTVFIIYFFKQANISSSQWLAVALQACGLLITLYRPASGMDLSWTTYVLALLQVFTSCLAGIYNTELYKEFNVSVHLGNMILYATGSVVNLLIHIVLTITSKHEAAFFAGYDNLGTWIILSSGVPLSLAMTAVFKYAVVRAMASSLASSILLYLSHVFFHVELPLVALPGMAVIFLATWLYTMKTVSGDDVLKPGMNHLGNWAGHSNSSLDQGFKSFSWYPMSLTLIYTFLTIGTVSGIRIWKN